MYLSCETARIRTDRILECNCFSHVSSKSWSSDGVNFSEIFFLSIVPGENKALGHKKTNLVFTPQICSYCIFNKQMDFSFLDGVHKQ